MSTAEAPIQVESTKRRCVLIGGGPAGLTAAYELAHLGIEPIVLEKDRIVGGISRTVEYKGYGFDIGGHRFFTKIERVNRWWDELLGDDMMERPRLSRILYSGKFFDYPLKPINALFGLGLFETFRVGVSFVMAQLFPSKDERNLEQWVTNRFGKRLYEVFFKTYTEKVWGMPCTEIGADWAAQRIKNLDLLKAVKNALLGSGGGGKGEVLTTLIEKFKYPKLGPGMMWTRVAEKLDAMGHPVELGVSVTKLRLADGRITAVSVRTDKGAERDIPADYFISTMPIRELVNSFEPAAPAAVIAAANQLRYRDFVTVGLILNVPDPFPDNWIYIHSPAVKVGRIQNFKAWSPHMVPDPATSSVGLEYFVQQNDEVWSAADADLIKLAERECIELKLIPPGSVKDGVVIRMPKAYPVYDAVYQTALTTIRAWLATIPNLQLVGRNGQHRYNNQDHSMLTAMLAVENIMGSEHDVWDVNTEEDYHEEEKSPAKDKGALAKRGGDQLVPLKLEIDPLQDELVEAFARFDPVALGAAIGTIAGVCLFLATAVLLIRGGNVVGPTLSLVGEYVLGFEVTWSGAVIGLVELGLVGFIFGFLLAKAINGVVALHERALIKQLEVGQVLDGVDG